MRLKIKIEIENNLVASNKGKKEQKMKGQERKEEREGRRKRKQVKKSQN